MSGRKPEKDIQHIDTIRCIIGFGTGITAFICEKELDGQMGKHSVLLILLMMGLSIVTLIMLLPIALRGVPEALARKCNQGRRPSGGSYDGEAVDFFETHPYETNYTDSHGTGWDNTFFDD